MLKDFIQCDDTDEQGIELGSQSWVSLAQTRVLPESPKQVLLDGFFWPPSIGEDRLRTPKGRPLVAWPHEPKDLPQPDLTGKENKKKLSELRGWARRVPGELRKVRAQLRKEELADGAEYEKPSAVDAEVFMVIFERIHAWYGFPHDFLKLPMLLEDYGDSAGLDMGYSTLKRHYQQLQRFKLIQVRKLRGGSAVRVNFDWCAMPFEFSYTVQSRR